MNRQRSPEGLDRYFQKRVTQRQNPDDDIYWGCVTDPDGVRRNRLSERRRYLQDVKRELDFVNGLPPGRVLDIGCGPGFFLSGIDDGWRKFGVEISKTAAQVAAQFGSIHNGPVETAGFEDESFDLVILHHVIEHLPDPVSTMREIRNLLRKGGHLMLGTPDFDSGCARRFGENYRLLNDDTHISLFSADSMHRLLRDLGFVIHEVDFPFFDTRHFTSENLLRLSDTTQVSPPFYGNFMTFYCRKPQFPVTVRVLQRLGMVCARELEVMEEKLEGAVCLLKDQVFLWGADINVLESIETRKAGAAPWQPTQTVIGDIEVRCIEEAGSLRGGDETRKRVLLLSPGPSDSTEKVLTGTTRDEWLRIGIVPESMLNGIGIRGLDVVIPVPMIDDIPPAAAQTMLIQALLRDFADIHRCH